MSESIKEQALKAGGTEPLKFKVKITSGGKEEIIILTTYMLEIEMKQMAASYGQDYEWDVLEFGTDIT